MNDLNCKIDYSVFLQRLKLNFFNFKHKKTAIKRLCEFYIFYKLLDNLLSMNVAENVKDKSITLKNKHRKKPIIILILFFFTFSYV